MSLRGLFLAALLVSAAANDEEVTKEFQAKPGSGSTTVEISNSASTKCSFKFSCNGGTGETWGMKLNKDRCSVYNLSGDGVSYLYFEFVSIAISGPGNPSIFSTFSDPADLSEFETSATSSESGPSFKHSIHELGIEYAGSEREL